LIGHEHAGQFIIFVQTQSGLFFIFQPSEFLTIDAILINRTLLCIMPIFFALSFFDGFSSVNRLK